MVTKVKFKWVLKLTWKKKMKVVTDRRTQDSEKIINTHLCFPFNAPPYSFSTKNLNDAIEAILRQIRHPPIANPRRYASCSMEAYIFRLHTSPSAESLSPFALEPLVDRDHGQVVWDSWVGSPVYLRIPGSGL